MRGALLVVAAAATAFAQDTVAERVRGAVVEVESVDRALLEAHRLRRQKAAAAALRDLHIHQPYVMRLAGVAISRDGEIVTAALHPRADLRVTVTLPGGDRVDADVLGTDPRSNLALLKVDHAFEDPLSLEDLAAEAGETVHLVGHVVQRDGLEPLDVDGPVAREHVSVWVRDPFGLTRTGRFAVASAFTIVTTPAYPSPGSACVDARGRLLGVVIGCAPPRWVRDEDAPGRVRAEQWHFAQPAVRVARVVRDLRAHGRVVRSQFGIRFEAVSDEVRAHFPHLPLSACTITHVQPGGPAAKAGLRIHDVVLGLDGRNYRDVHELGEAMSDKAPGEPVTFRILRAGEEQEIEATPAEWR